MTCLNVMWTAIESAAAAILEARAVTIEMTPGRTINWVISVVILLLRGRF